MKRLEPLLMALSILVLLGAACTAGPVEISPVHKPTPPATATGAPTPAPVLPQAATAAPEPAQGSTPAAEPVPASHTVQSGDTLLGLAMEYGVPMAAIQLQNRMGSSTVVHVGDALSIPPRAAWEGASPFWIVHVVEAGETLTGIARTYGLPPGALQAANGLVDADLLGTGQELILPLDGPAALAQSPAPTATPIPPTATSAAPAGAPEALPEATAAPPPATAVVAAAPPADLAAWPRETVRLINEVRAAHGLPPLIYNETLAAAAQAHANDCRERGWCSHTGSDGSDIKARILRVGYDPAGWAECWAQRKTPQGAVDIWMDEVPPNDPHRRTLLTTWLSEIGVGVAETDWGYYFIADFGRP